MCQSPPPVRRRVLCVCPRTITAEGVDRPREQRFCTSRVTRCEWAARPRTYTPSRESTKCLDYQITDVHLEISDEKEYIPIHATHFHPYIHTPTHYDQTFFLFDQAQNLCPPLHFQADPICLMVHAQPHLSSLIRLDTDRAAAAQSDVTLLLTLYKRIPGGKQDNSITVSAAYDSGSMVQRLPSHSSIHVLPTMASSPPSSSPPLAPSRRSSFHLEIPGLTPSSSANTMDASEDTETSTDPQLLEYSKERAVTWEDLKSRPPIYPGEGGGDWQFSSAEQIIRGEWH